MMKKNFHLKNYVKLGARELSVIFFIKNVMTYYKLSKF